MERKELGKISAASFGWGGYQDCQVGLSLSFSMKGSGVNDFKGAWGTKHSEHCKWTEQDRLTELGKTAMELAGYLQKINGKDVSDLVGTPVELTFDGNLLKEWRILDEVL